MTSRDGQLTLTPAGQAEFERVAEAWATWLYQELGSATETPVTDDEFRAGLRTAARDMVTTDSYEERVLAGSTT